MASCRTLGVTRTVSFVFSAVAVLASGWALAQEARKDPPPRARGVLPQNWNRLGLTEEQKQKVYTIQAEYRSKIEALEAQIKELRGRERSELEKVLTEEQRKALAKIITEKVPGAGDLKKDEDKKPDK
jgi:Spy/CpxP family protein refolding chaperone